MARYTYALRGAVNDSQNEIRIEEFQVDLMKGEQLTEHFLCDINPAGEVRYLYSALPLIGLNLSSRFQSSFLWIPITLYLIV